MSDGLHDEDSFVRRHNGPRGDDVTAMLGAVGVDDLHQLIEETVPGSIRMEGELELGDAVGEYELLQKLRGLAAKNSVCQSYIGMGYSRCITPPVIQRNILENPGWYTQYTPYQSEIAQGRLEALLNFQSMVCDLTGFELSNASLLDEATAAAEALSMLRAVQPVGGRWLSAIIANTISTTGYLRLCFNIQQQMELYGNTKIFVIGPMSSKPWYAWLLTCSPYACCDHRGNMGLM